MITMGCKDRYGAVESAAFSRWWIQRKKFPSEAMMGGKARI